MAFAAAQNASFSVSIFRPPGILTTEDSRLDMFLHQFLLADSRLKGVQGQAKG